MGGLVVLLMIVFVAIRYANASAQKTQAQQQRKTQNQPQPRHPAGPYWPEGIPKIPGIPGIPMIPIFDEEDRRVLMDEVDEESLSSLEGAVSEEMPASGEAQASATDFADGQAQRYTVGNAAWGSMDEAFVEGSWHTEGTDGGEGEKAAEHNLHLHRMRVADATEDAYGVSAGGEYALDIHLNRENALSALVYAEIFAKPKALRR